MKSPRTAPTIPACFILARLEKKRDRPIEIAIIAIYIYIILYTFPCISLNAIASDSIPLHSITLHKYVYIYIRCKVT